MNRGSARPFMKIGSWVWSADQKEQRRTLRRVASSDHLMAAMQAIAKSKDGLSNAEIDSALDNNSNWLTRWVIDQLISMGFLEYKIELFGGPGKYTLTELGWNAFSAITGKPRPAQPQPPKPQPAAPSQTRPTTPPAAH
jgi:hypothetical protein